MVEQHISTLLIKILNNSFNFIKLAFEHLWQAITQPYAPQF